jgi:hypothetical protein
MSPHDGHGHAWLFSFVDLAFLLLMVMSQLADPNAGPPLGEIVVPAIEAPDARPLRVAARPAWQLRVHPKTDGLPPYELTRPEGEAGPRIDRDALRVELAKLHAEGAGKPLLAPHADSRSEDMLEALAALVADWASGRPAAVTPRVALR